MIVAADIGATNSRLGLFTPGHGRPECISQAKFANRDFTDLEDLLRHFDTAGQAVNSVCFGVAGPVLDGRSFITNLNWELDTALIARHYPGACVRLINDVEANGYGAALLEPAELFVLNPGTPQPRATAALIAAGTGLGEAILYHDGGQLRPLPSEAGHSDFAPNTPLETDFLCFMRERFGHVSNDRVVSGPGLALMYEFLTTSGRAAVSPQVTARMNGADPSAVIAEAALAGECPACELALELFVGIFGAEAGNLALRSLALGGVFLGGGIAPKIRGKLAEGGFLRAFCAKGRMSELLQSIPVSIILNPDTALLGAAWVANRQLAQSRAVAH